MFRLSKAAEYAVRGVLYLSIKGEGELTDIEEISKAQDVPLPYLSKIFQTLGRKGYVRSFRGSNGGFILAKKSEDINLLEIIEALEGPIFLNDCLIRKGYCPRDNVCAVHDVWKGAQKRFIDYLGGCTFDSLANASIIKVKKADEKGLALCVLSKGG